MKKDAQTKLDDLANRIERAEAPEEKTDKTPSAYGKASSLAVRVVIDFAVPVGAGVWIGRWLDGYLDISPLSTVIFALLGFGAGIMNIIRLANGQDDMPTITPDDKKD